MTMTLELPEMLQIPEKLIPLITEFNKYRYFLIEGGRVGAKSQSVGRVILYFCDQYGLRVVCGRETQNSIEESVYTLLKDLILDNSLYFNVLASKITHGETKAEIKFKGFREQGRINIKGLEGIDILWIDEAQSITKPTLDVIIPTIRKENAKIIFTMNRFLRNDPVYEEFAGREDCLHIKINYTDNPHCPESSKREAEECRQKSEADYRHIWLGEPLDQSIEFLFNFAKLDRARTIEAFGDLFIPQSVMAVDFAGGGGDSCVASLLKRRSNVHWELADQRCWRDPDTDLSVGKTIALKGLWKPDIAVGDKGGLGYPMFISISKVIPDFIGFDGAGEGLQENAGNQRADGYLTLKEFIDQEWLIVKSRETLKELEAIKRKYRANGQVYIQSKEEMRKDGHKSPDRADSLMMAVWAIRYHLGRMKSGISGNVNQVKRVNARRWS